MLNNLSIRKKLALLLVGPVLMLIVVSAISLKGSLDESSKASNAERLVEMSTVNSDLFAAVRAEAVLDQLAPSNNATDSRDQEAATDSILGRWLGAANGFTEYDADGLIGDIGNFETHRSAAGASTAQAAHNTNVEMLTRIAAFDARIAAAASGDAAVELGRAAALTNTELLAADSQLLGLWAAGEGVIPPGDLAVKLGATEAAVAAFNSGVPDDRAIEAPTGTYRRSVVAFAAESPGQLTTVSVEDWLSSSQDRSDALGVAHNATLFTADANAASAASSARSSLRTTGLLSLLGILVGAGVALGLGSQMKARVAAINDEASAIAQNDLPELANALRTGQTLGGAPDRPVLEARGTDEFADLEHSLNRIRESANEVGTQQTELLQTGISDMFVNLARRNQTLVDRQLQVIDELEAEERDPDRLSQMYRVDHLATRMRRNAESLLVLAGQTSTRRRGPAVDLREVVRVAIGEVEDYRRIIPIALDEIAVAAHVAQDLAHLLSELMENATQSSPPGTVADVIGVSDADGSYTLQVIDRGTGIDDDHRAELNDALNAPPTNSLAMSRTMGLTVVGRLSQRLGVMISLNAGSDGGTVATVDIPTEVVAEWHGESPGTLTNQAIQTIPGQFARPVDPAVVSEPTVPFLDDGIQIAGFDAAPAPVTTAVDEAEFEEVIEATELIEAIGEVAAPDYDDAASPFGEPFGDFTPPPPTSPFPSGPDEEVSESFFPTPEPTEVLDDLGIPLFDLPSLDPANFGQPMDDDSLFGEIDVPPLADLSLPVPPVVLQSLDEQDVAAQVAYPVVPPPIPVFEVEPVVEVIDEIPPSSFDPVDEPIAEEIDEIPPSSFDPLDEPVAEAIDELPPTSFDCVDEQVSDLIGELPPSSFDPVDVPVSGLIGEIAPMLDPVEAIEPEVVPAAPAAQPAFPEAAADRAFGSNQQAPPAPSNPPMETAPFETAEHSDTTPSGLIRRQRKAPMSDAQAAFDRTPATTPSKRSPDQVKSMLSRYKSGLERGRTDGE